MTYLDSSFTVNANTRAVQGTWHELVVQAARTEQIFRERGDSREADQVRIYATMFAQFAAMHLKRIVEANGNGGSNGHHKDSASASTQATAEAPVETSPATADERVACTDCGCSEIYPPESPAVTVPSNGNEDVEGRIQTMIAQFEDLMVKHRDHQPYEVALKMLHRGRTLAREGKAALADRQLRAAFNAAHDAKEMGVS